MSRQARELSSLCAIVFALAGCQTPRDEGPFDPHESCRDELEQLRRDKESRIGELEKQLSVLGDDMVAIKRHTERQERELEVLRQSSKDQGAALEAAIGLVKARDQELVELKAAPPEDTLRGVTELLRQKDEQIKRLRDELVARASGDQRELPPDVRVVRSTSSTVDMNQPVAMIDDQVLTRGELAEHLYCDMLSIQYLQPFLDRHLVLRAAAKQGISVSDLDAEAWIATQVLDQVKQAGSEAAWQKRLLELGLDRKAWEAKARYIAKPMLLLHRLVERERDTIEGRRLFEERVRTAYEESYSTRVSGRQIFIGLPENATGVQEAQARRLAEQILLELEKGASFADLAQKYSQDPTRSVGGYLGEFDRTKFADVPELNTAFFSLEIGRPSRPIRTRLGYHLALVDDRRQPSRPFDEAVRRELTEKLKNQPPSDQELLGVLDRLRRSSKIKTVLGLSND